jgi:hypothetical protein
MQTVIVKAQDVRVGDELCSTHTRHPAFRWHRIREITKKKVAVRLEGGEVKEIDGFKFDCGYLSSAVKDEAVYVRRRT